MELALRVMEVPRAHTLLQRIAQNSQDIRYLIRGAGVAGDPHYVPWLIKQMADVKLTRLAGESFSTVTGLDLAYLDLEAQAGWNFETGPNDNPDDPNVEMDPDDGLPWPDPEKMRRMVDCEPAPVSGGRPLLYGQPADARALRRGVEDRLSASAHRGRAIPLPAQSRHAALQHERAGMAAEAASRETGLSAVACEFGEMCRRYPRRRISSSAFYVKATEVNSVRPHALIC